MIHREGHTLLLVLLVVFAGFAWALRFFGLIGVQNFYVLVFSLAVVYLLVLQFFRNPKVNTPFNDGHLIAPADGKVVVIEETVENEYFNGPRMQISIFMSPLNVHVNRNPISGIVRYFKYHPGKYLVAWHPKASTENERTTVVVQHAQGQEVLYRQIAGALAKRIKWYIKTGDQVQQGAEFGFIKFGSRVDIFVPVGTKVMVELNQVTVGGETIIASFV